MNPIAIIPNIEAIILFLEDSLILGQLFIIKNVIIITKRLIIRYLGIFYYNISFYPLQIHEVF